MSLHDRDKAFSRLKSIEEREYVGPIVYYIKLLEKEIVSHIEANKQTKGSSPSECTCGKRKSSGITYPGYE